MTVTNFSDTSERIDIWATRDSGSRILRTVELPAKASVHINMQQDFTQRAAELQPLRDRAYDRFFIRAESPTAQILAKGTKGDQGDQAVPTVKVPQGSRGSAEPAVWAG